jgi:hypothetical protein
VLAELYTSVEQAFAERALNLYNNGGCSLRYLQEVQGMEPKKNVYLDVYKLGPTTLVREEDLEAYAQACLEKAGAPASAPTPFMPHPGQPQLPAQTTVTEEPTDTDNPDSAPDDGKRLLSSQSRQETKILDLSSKEEKAAYMAKLEEQRATWESEVEDRMQTYFKSERKAMSKALETCSTQQQVEGAIDKTLSGQEDTLKQAVYDIWYDVAKDFSESTIKQLQEAEKSYNPCYQTKGFFSIFTSKIISWLLNLSSTKVKQINDTTRTQLRQSLADGVEAGESIPQIAKRIDQLYLQEIIPNRSTVIARTEVISSSNWASMASAEGSGLTLNKVWLATEDSRTRPAHAEADGQKVAMNEPFEVGGEKLMFAGDPAGSAQNVCQCRCTQYYERVKDGESEESDDQETAINHVLVINRKKTPYRAFMEAYTW